MEILKPGGKTYTFNFEDNAKIIGCPLNCFVVFFSEGVKGGVCKTGILSPLKTLTEVKNGNSDDSKEEESSLVPEIATVSEEAMHQ
jgi:hypothetical protein